MNQHLSNLSITVDISSAVTPRVSSDSENSTTHTSALNTVSFQLSFHSHLTVEMSVCVLLRELSRH